MRDLVSCFAAGALAMLAVVMIAQPGDANTPNLVSAPNAPMQTVDRSNKGDRLTPPTAVKPAAPQERPRMMTGCDPAFSPLSVSAQNNFAARCVA